jgi:hypothetical protein
LDQFDAGWLGEPMPQITYIPFIGYLRIAADAHARMIEYVNGGEAENAYFQNTAQGEATITVVFSTIALESFIHNYAARKLGEGYTDKHVERMNLHTKWLLVPQLAMGKAIPSDHRGIQLLQKLIKARNCIVHLKAKDIEWELWDSAEQKITETNRLILKSAVNCFECTGLLGHALGELDPDDQATKLLASFTSTPKYRIVEKGP